MDQEPCQACDDTDCYAEDSQYGCQCERHPPEEPGELVYDRPYTEQEQAIADCLDRIEAWLWRGVPLRPETPKPRYDTSPTIVPLSEQIKWSPYK